MREVREELEELADDLRERGDRQDVKYLEELPPDGSGPGSGGRPPTRLGRFDEVPVLRGAKALPASSPVAILRFLAASRHCP